MTVSVTKLMGTKYELGPSFAVSAQGRIRLNDAVSVKDFGAVGDGVKDDAAAIQAAINSVGAAGGGEVYFPRGQYRVNTTVNVTSGGVLLRGQEGSVIVNATASSPAIRFGDDTTIKYGGGVEQLAFAQAAGVTPSGNNAGLRFDLWGQARLSDVTITEFPAKLRYGLFLYKLSQSTLYGIAAQGCIVDGIRMERCVDIYCANARSDANAGSGFVLVDHGGAYFANCTAWNNSSYGWQVGKSALSQSNDLFFTNCVGDNSGAYNWTVADTKRALLTNCWAATQQSLSVNTWASGFVISGACQSVGLHNCIAAWNNKHGLEIIGGVDVSVIGGFYGTPENPNGRAGSGSGIRINDDVVRASVTGATCRANPDYGVSTGANVEPLLQRAICD